MHGNPVHTLPLVYLLIALAAGVSAGCAPATPESPRALTYAHLVPVGVTYDLRSAQTVEPTDLAAALADVRLLFLGEHHSDPRSHAFQLEVLLALADSRRPIAVALEMFPPQADPALDDWRRGLLDEETFLERSGWYRHWGFPWAYYRELFWMLRARRIPVHGVNASPEVRAAVRAGKPEDLPADVRDVLGDLDAGLPGHQAYLQDALREAGHSEPGTNSDTFRRFYRVQRMWDRLMGVRTAQLAQAQRDGGITVLLIGSGHLAYGLGANLHAAQTARMNALTLWNTVVPRSALDAQRRYGVPAGMADWARVDVQQPDAVDYPSLHGVRFADSEAEAKADAGDPVDSLRVRSVFVRNDDPLARLKSGDVLLALNGKPLRSETALRLAWERLPRGVPVLLRVQREGEAIDLELVP